MSKISQENITKLNAVMQQIWQTVGRTTSDAAGWTLTFSDPEAGVAPLSELYAELATPRLVIQFAFANKPEQNLVVLADNDFLSPCYRAFTGNKSTIDEAAVGEMRPLWESLVQGICLAVGQIKGEAVVATNLTIRHQTLSFPPNMQRSDDVVRTKVKVSADSFEGSFVLLTDFATTGLFIDEIPADLVGNPTTGDAPTEISYGSGPTLEESAFDMLMDVPLDITVELGRVKMLVKDVLELGAGSIIEIDKAAGEPVDVFVNGRLAARGEVVVIEDNFGVRITEILSIADRVGAVSEAA